MILGLLLIVGLCGLGVLHTYLLYPFWVLHLARTRVQWKDQEEQSAEVVDVAVLMAVHNEEAVLEEKLASLAAQDYAGGISIYIGSDCSTDRTNAILREWAAKDERFHPTLFELRQGKPGIINQLAVAAEDKDVFIITDASVILQPDTISALVKPMTKDERIGVVDATMLQTGALPTGIGRSEKTYIDREVKIKRAEGDKLGHTIGPFGGCWAIRAAAYQPVPPNFLVDDFFLCMAAYEQGYLGVSSAEAMVYEGVGQSISDEFRRKVRISSGNWQNLFRFRQLWWPFWKNRLAFAFFSHKVLRWWTPFFLLIGAAGGVLLALLLGNHWFTAVLCVSGLALVSVLIMDYVLDLLNIHLPGFRNLRYFLAMNAALLVGFWRFLTGIKSNVWQPSNRN